MIDRRTNPLIIAGSNPGRFERGSDAAGQQLQDHCDRLNAMKGDKHWFVAGKAPERRVDCLTKTTSHPHSPQATPEEVSAIMRKHGLS